MNFAQPASTHWPAGHLCFLIERKFSETYITTILITNYNTKRFHELLLWPANLFYNLFDKRSESQKAAGLLASCCLDSFIDFSCCCQLCVDVDVDVDDERMEAGSARQRTSLQWRQKVSSVILTRKSVNYTPASTTNDELFRRAEGGWGGRSQIFQIFIHLNRFYGIIEICCTARTAPQPIQFA